MPSPSQTPRDTYGPVALTPRERQLVEVFRQVPSVFINHRPHRPDHAPESAVLHRSSKVQRFVGDARLGQLSRVTG